MKFNLMIIFSCLMICCNAQWQKGDTQKDNPFSDNKPFYFNLSSKACGVGILNIDLLNLDGRAALAIGYFSGESMKSPFTMANYEEHIVNLAVKLPSGWKKFIVILPTHSDNQEPTFFLKNDLMDALKQGSQLVIKLEGSRNYLEDCNGLASFNLKGFSTACKNLGL